jgi:hypothetical protein
MKFLSGPYAARFSQKVAKTLILHRFAPRVTALKRYDAPA